MQRKTTSKEVFADCQKTYVEKAKIKSCTKRKAPLCKGGCQRKLTGGLFFEKILLLNTIPPSFASEIHLPLHKGGFKNFYFCVKSRSQILKLTLSTH